MTTLKDVASNCTTGEIIEMFVETVGCQANILDEYGNRISGDGEKAVKEDLERSKIPLIDAGFGGNDFDAFEYIDLYLETIARIDKSKDDILKEQIINHLCDMEFVRRLFIAKIDGWYSIYEKVGSPVCGEDF